MKLIFSFLILAVALSKSLLASSDDNFSEPPAYQHSVGSFDYPAHQSSFEYYGTSEFQIPNSQQHMTPEPTPPHPPSLGYYELPAHQPSNEAYISLEPSSPEPPKIERILDIQHFKRNEGTIAKTNEWISGIAMVTMLLSDGMGKEEEMSLECLASVEQKEYRECVEHQENDPNQQEDRWLTYPQFTLWHGVRVYQQTAFYTFRIPENSQLTFEKTLPVPNSALLDLQWTSTPPPETCSFGTKEGYSQPLFSSTED